MTTSDIYEAIGEFLSLIEGNDSPADDSERALSRLLDHLALAYHYAEGVFDESDFPDPPQNDYFALRKMVSERFPHYGFYHIVSEASEPTEPASLQTGDAIDDIADIASDLRSVYWRWKNTSEADALWHFVLDLKHIGAGT